MSKRLALLVYLFGNILILTAAVLALWPAFEASRFHFEPSYSSRSESDLSSLNCPIAITESEKGAISAEINNTSTRRARFATRSFLTIGGTRFSTHIRDEIYLDAGQSDSFNLPISNANMVYDRMIMANVRVLRSGSVPMQQGTCGIWVFNGAWAQALGLRGQTIYWAIVLLGLGCIALGGWLLRPQNGWKAELTERGGSRTGFIFTGVVLATLWQGLRGDPILGFSLLLGCALLIVVIVEQAANGGKV